MTDNLRLLRELLDREVELVVIGGVAAALHGSSVITYDLDLCIPFTEESFGRLLPFLAEIDARFRAHPAKPLIEVKPAKYLAFRHLLLDTDLGAVDFLREVTGLGGYSEVLARSQLLDLGGTRCSVLSLDGLLVAKRAAGRSKDLRMLPELERLARQEKP